MRFGCERSCGGWPRPTRWCAAAKMFPFPGCSRIQPGERLSYRRGAAWARVRAECVVRLLNSCSTGIPSPCVHRFFRYLSKAGLTSLINGVRSHNLDQRGEALTLEGGCGVLAKGSVNTLTTTGWRKEVAIRWPN